MQQDFYERVKFIFSFISYYIVSTLKFNIFNISYCLFLLKRLFQTILKQYSNKSKN